MSSTSVSQFADELKMPADALLEQLRKAGVKKAGAGDDVSEADKTRLLDFLRRSHGEAEGKTKITLTRKETSAIKAQGSSGKTRTVQVEVRKKRVLVKREAAVENEPVPVVEPVAPASPVIDETELRNREEEARRQSELADRQAADIKEKQERELELNQIPSIDRSPR